MISVQERKPEKVTTKPIGTTRSFISNAKSKDIQWYCCTKGHYAVECKEVSDIQKRREIVQEGRRCFVCLKLGHSGKIYGSGIKCKVCRTRHNQVFSEVDFAFHSSEAKWLSAIRAFFFLL